jgi:hypothetical protein
MKKLVSVLPYRVDDCVAFSHVVHARLEFVKLSMQMMPAQVKQYNTMISWYRTHNSNHQQVVWSY